jgi:DNA primase
LGFSLPGWDPLLKAIGVDAESKQLLLRAGLLIKKDDGGFYDRFRDRLMFPIRDARGRTIGFGGRVIGAGDPKYLNSPETEIFHKGSELYGLYETRTANPSPPRILIVEGYMDVIALAQYGINYAVATLGTATTSQHIELLFRYTSELVFCFDGDRAGQQASVRALKIVLPLMREGVQVKFMFLPAEEDPDSQVRKEGVELFGERLLKAKSMIQYFFEFLSEGLDITQMEGRAALVGLAKPYVHSVSSDIFRHFLLQELSNRQLVGQGAAPAISAAPVSVRPSSLARYAMTLLMQYPVLIQQVMGQPSFYGEHPDDQLLNALIQFLREKIFASTQDIVDSWPDKRQAEILQQLALAQTDIPASGVEAEFVGAMRQIQRLSLSHEVTVLINKGKSPDFSEADRQRLRQLLAEKRKAELFGKE